MLHLTFEAETRVVSFRYDEAGRRFLLHRLAGALPRDHCFFVREDFTDSPFDYVSIDCRTGSPTGIAELSADASALAILCPPHAIELLLSALQADNNAAGEACLRL